MSDNEILPCSSQSIQKRSNVIESDDCERVSNGEKRRKSTSNDGFEEPLNDVLHKYNFGEVTIKSLSKKSNGDVWKYFGHVQKNDRIVPALEKKIICKQCFENRIWKCYSVSTSATTLYSHLQNEHSYERNGGAVKTTQNMLLTSFFSKTNTAIQHKEHPTLKSKEDRERYIFYRYIVVWICRDLLPFSLVCGAGFNLFWKKFNPKSHLALPSRTTIAGQALDDAYRCIKQQLIDCLKNAQKHGAITFDGWTDSHKRISYITFTYHFIDKDWKLYSTVLKTAHFEAPHNATRTKDMYRNMIDEFELKDKIIVGITDGGGNMKAACNMIKIKRLKCIAHEINRLIQFDLLDKNKNEVKPFCELIDKLRKIQRTLVYKHHELTKIYKRDQHERIFVMMEQLEVIEEHWDASEKFKDIIDSLDSGSFNGMKSFSTVRWSCVYILTKFHEDYASTIQKCLQDNYKYDMVLSKDETELLCQLVKLLEVFHRFTKYIQGNTYATQNLLPIMYTEIEYSLNCVVEQYSLNDENDVFFNDEYPQQNVEPVVVKAAKILLDNMEQRLELSPESVVAAIVDPAMQHLAIIDKWLRKNNLTRASLIRNVCKDLQIEITSEEISTNSSDSMSSIVSTDLDTNTIDKTVKGRSLMIESLLQTHCPGAVRYNNTLEYELQLFQDAPSYTDPIAFWMEHNRAYPKLAAIAKVVLIYPLTTSKAEGEFSVSGCLIRSRRSSITPSKVEKVLFVHDNFHLLDQ